MKYLYAALVFAVFALGAGIGGVLQLSTPETNAVFTTVQTHRGIQLEEYSYTKDTPQTLTSTASRLSLEGPVERDSPGDWIAESDIQLSATGFSVHADNIQWAILADTNSMDPLFDVGSHLMQVIPQSQEQIHVGDIVSYESPLGFVIVHRVIEIGSDEEGWYAIMKGDNNPSPDPWKVRFDMVRRVTIGVIY